MGVNAVLALFLIGLMGAMALMGAGTGHSLWQRRRRYRVRARAAEKAPDLENQPWAGAELVYPADKPACPSVRKLAGKRLLHAELPELPLPDCACQNCHCSYQYFEDRREVERDTTDSAIALMTRWLPVAAMRELGGSNRQTLARRSIAERQQAQQHWKARREHLSIVHSQPEPKTGTTRQRNKPKVSAYQR